MGLDAACFSCSEPNQYNFLTYIITITYIRNLALNCLIYGALFVFWHGTIKSVYLNLIRFDA
jgi:hypothetical protein